MNFQLLASKMLFAKFRLRSAAFLSSNIVLYLSGDLVVFFLLICFLPGEALRLVFYFVCIYKELGRVISFMSILSAGLPAFYVAVFLIGGKGL